MRFLSEKLLKIIGSTVRYANSFMVCPFDWNERLNLFQYAESNWNLWKWKSTTLLFFLHQIFLCRRYWTVLVDPDHHDFFFTIMQGCQVGVFFFVCVLQLSFILNGRDWVRFLNRLIHYVQTLEGKV